MDTMDSFDRPATKLSEIKYCNLRGHKTPVIALDTCTLGADSFSCCQDCFNVLRGYESLLRFDGLVKVSVYVSDLSGNVIFRLHAEKIKIAPLNVDRECVQIFITDESYITVFFNEMENITTSFDGDFLKVSIINDATCTELSTLISI